MPKLRTQPPSQDDIRQVGDAIRQAATFYQEGKLDAAEKICTRLIKAWPALSDAHHLLGLVKLAGGKAGAALAHLERALQLNPQSGHALANLSMVLASLNRDADALATVDRALTLTPDNVEALNNRGNVLMKLSRPAEALIAFEWALTREPRFLSASLNRGNALAALGRHAEALAQYDEVIAAVPEQVAIHGNRATTLLALGRPADALESYDKVLAANPRDARALAARGSAMHALNRNGEAIESYTGAIAIDKNQADAHHNLALSLLTLGDYGRGFEEFEWRWQRTGMAARRRSVGKPLWLGEYPLQRKTILLYAEQGLGDTIQFVRYAPILARAGASVVLEVPRAMAGLMGRVAGVARVVAAGDALPAFDVQCPLASLPRALRTEPSNIPSEVPYLTPDPERVAKWRGRIEGLPSPRVAIAWAGSASHPNDRNRSIPFKQLAPLLAGGNASFVSIQHDLRAGDDALLAQWPTVLHVGPELHDFDDTAAVLSLVDVVISVDTSVVHLAGALGRPTWVLLPYCPDWRWMLDRADSPWYPGARLYRQPAPGDWEQVLSRVQADLPLVVA